MPINKGFLKTVMLKNVGFVHQILNGGQNQQPKKKLCLTECIKFGITGNAKNSVRVARSLRVAYHRQVMVQIHFLCKGHN